jgi:hypothetical protein
MRCKTRVQRIGHVCVELVMSVGTSSSGVVSGAIVAHTVLCRASRTHS